MTISAMNIGCALMLVTLAMQSEETVDASATLELRMNNFQNPSEHTWNGECCDLFCIGQCDNIFHFALDTANGLANDPKTYYYWVKVTGTYQDQNSNTFNSDMKGVSNPIISQFDSWPGSVLFKVYIEDDDSPYTANDPLDGMIQRLQLIPFKTKASATATTITIIGTRPRDKTTLSIDYTLYCNDNYYGQSCSVFCLAQDSEQLGHYTCDPDTGAKLCRTGWEDNSTNCITYSDDCGNNQCMNGARCVDGNHSYTCSCVEGYTGRYCDVNINECVSNPCQNGGTCSDLVNGYTCACGIGYVGPQCAQNACRQGQNPCLNGGTCYTSGSQLCLCPTGFTGNRCEMRTCEAVPCLNGGICTSNSTCICPAEFTGNQCEVKICDMVAVHCQNGGTCFNGTCVCRSPYRGVNCEKEACTGNTCLNGGTCYDTETGYQCRCQSNFTGSRCESPFPVNNQNPNFQGLNSNDMDVSIFQDDAGKLLIALIVICIVFFIIIIVLVCILMCLRRRRNKKNAPIRVASGIVRRQDSIDGVAVVTRTENFYLSRLGTEKSVHSELDKGKSGKIPENWKLPETPNGQPDNGENHYEILCEAEASRNQDGVENDKYDTNPTVEGQMKELYVCEIKDIHGDTIHLEKKLADC